MRLSFDGFDIDTESGQLFRGGAEVPLERRALDMLCYLASHPGRLVTKDELLSEVWQARTLSDGVLSNTAAKLRKALGQAAGARAPIETVRGRGFRWHATRVPVAGPEAASAAAGEARADPFVGRAQVLEIFERALDQAAQGQGQLVLMTGDPGMGKTRALDELARLARARGFSVWEGAAYDGGGAPAYWPWVEILRSAQTDLSRAMFRRHLAVDSWAMSLLVPELVAARSEATNADAPATRFRLFDEVARFIASASADAPRLILADDMHWADDGTLEFLAYTTRALKKRAVLFAVTLREHDTPPQAPRTAALQQLSRQATHVALSGLSLTEVEELVTLLDHSQPNDAQLADVLHRRTQGNPFFVRQTVELLAQRGVPLAAESVENLALPQAVRDVLRQRLGALGGETRKVLRMAAAAGIEFDAAVIADAIACPLAEVLTALEPARRRRVVANHGTTPHHFSFGHALLRDAIYDELDLSERGSLHARLGQVLERRIAGDDPRNLGEVARHHLLAVPFSLQACVQHCRDAARAARNALGFETAADLLSRATDKLESEGGDEHTRCELLLELGMDRFCCGDFRNAWRALAKGARLAERIGSTDMFARIVGRLAAWVELGGGDEDEIRRLVDRALSLIGDADPDLRATLLARRAEIHFELPHRERQALLSEADELAACRNTPLVLLELAVCRASLRDPSYLDEGRDAIAKCRTLLRRHATELTAPSRLLMSFAIEFGEYLNSLTRGDLTTADGALERCRRLAEESQLTAVGLGVELMEAGRALGDGRLDDLAATIERMRETSNVAGGFGLVWESYALRLVEAHGGLASMAGFDANSPPLDELRPSQRMNGALWLARMNAKIGTHDRARRLLASVPPEQLARMPVRYGDLGVLCFLADIYEELRDQAGAATLYQQLLPYAELNAVGPALDYGGAVARYLGNLARLLGRDADAAQHLERAEQINRQLRMPIRTPATQSTTQPA